MDVASQGLQDFSKVATEQVITALEKSRKMLINVNLRAPTVFIPESTTPFLRIFGRCSEISGKQDKINSENFNNLFVGFTKENGVTFVADLGNIVIKHDSSLQAKTSEVSTKNSNNGKFIFLFLCFCFG